MLYASVDDGASWAKIYTDSNLSGSISFSWTTSLPAEGNSSIQFQVADSADNNGSLTEQNYTLDITAPSQAVTLSSIKLSADTGTADDDFITNIDEQTISAELNASLSSGDVLYASVDDGVNWAKIYTDANLSGNTSFSWTTSLPTESTSSIQFQVADSADNNGSLTEQNYTLDQTAPSQAITLSSIKLSNDTGSSNTGFITNTAEQTISAELNASLSSGDVLYASVDDGASWAKIYTDSNLSGSISFSWTTSLPAEGNSSIQFQVADSADNNGSLTEQNYTLDQTAPSQAVTLSSIKLSNDTGSSNTDFITNTAEQSISAELNASLSSGDVLYASIDDGANWAKIYTDSNLSGSISFSWTTSLPAEGNSSIQFQVADSADNNGSLTEQNYTLDQTEPSQAVTLSSIKLSTDTGSSNTDFITNTAEQTISAELNASLSSGDVLYASIDDGANWAKIYTDSNLSDSTSISWPATLPAEGNSSIQFQVADSADNNGSLTEQNYTLDQTAPSQAVTLSSIKLSTDTGSSNTDFITNTAEQSISAELNAILGTGDVLYASVDDGASWAKIYTDSNLSDSTSFSWTTSLPAEGNSSIQFQVADSADNNGSFTEQNYTLDQTAPSQAVTLSSIKLSTDTGSSNTDFITNTAEQTISAELNAILGTGDVLYASVDDGASWAKIYTDSNLSDSTSFSWTTSLPAEGNSSIQFQVADSADNNGSLTEQNYTLDQTAPSQAVTLSSIKLSTDTGSSNTDFITNTAEQTISAELNAILGTGDVLYASVDDGASWAKIYTDSNLSGSISFSWTTSLPAEGNSSIQFQVADSADNNGSLTEQNYTLDQTAPSQAVTLSSIKLSNDTGSSNTDFITNTAEQSISAELNASLSSGDVLYASIDDGANWAKIYTDSNLSGSISFSWTTSLPAEGNSSIQFQVADSADNNGSLTEQNYTLDQTEPSQAVTLSSIKLSTDTGSSNTDFITNTAEQTISAELNASLSSGDVLYASVDGGSTWQQVDSSNISGTSISWPATLLNDTNTIQFQVVDSADNNGSLTEQNYTLDQTAPSQAVTLSSIKLSTDTGSSNTDFITNTAEQSISAELNAILGTGDVLYASVDDGASWAKIYTDSNLSDSTSFSWTTSLPAEGNSSIQFQVADSADNNGSFTEQNYTLDQTAPSQAVTLSSIKLSTDTGSSNTDFITNTAEQTISAELNASLSTGDVLYASVDSGSTWQQVDSSNISGTSISWPATLLNDTNTIQFQVADSADNNGSFTEQNYTLDQTAPSQAVTLSSIKLSTDTGSSNTDFITNTAEQTISAELNASLSTGDVLYASVDSGSTWQQVDSSNISGTSISWPATLPAEGNSSIQFQVADSADNNGSLTEQNYTLDQTAPSQAVTLSSIKLSTDTGSSNTDFITNTAEQTISAELNASLSTGDVLYASVDSGSTWQQVDSSNISGTSISWPATLPAEGNSSIQFQVADSADNNGSLTEQNYTLDQTAPSQAVTLSSIKLSTDTGSSNTDFITNTAEQTISAELNAILGTGDVLYASVDDGASWAKIYTDGNLSGSTSFSWTTSLPAEGNSSIQFQVADSADNNGSLTGQNYTLDQTAPSQAVTLSSIKLSTDTGSSNTDFITNTAEQTISAELNAILGTGDVLYASVDDGASWAKIYTDSNLSDSTSFSWTTSLPAEGNSSIQFQVADSADNNGSLTEQNYTLDQTAPSQAVTLSSIKLSTDTGSSNTDFITNTAEQTISAELNASLSSGDVLYASIDDGASWAKIYTDSNLSGSISFSWTTSLPAEGNSSIQFQVADSADNNGSLTEQNYTLDQTEPSQAVTLSSIKLSTDTGSSNTDFITNTAEQTISAELNASLSSGDVLYASIDDGASWAKIYTDSNLSATSFSWTASLPTESASSIQFQVADSADNNGSLTEQNYTLDQTAPSQAVTLSSIELSTDTGSSNTDFITNTAEQTISAELNASLSSGDVLYASIDDGANWAKIYTDANLSDSTSFSWTTSLPTESTNSIQFQVADSADNNGSLTEQNYTLDQTAPSQAVTISSIKLSNDTGSSNTDFITNTAEQSISAELNASLSSGDVLYASVDDGASWAKIYTDSNLSGSISFSWTTSLPAEGNSSIQFQVADSADNNGSLTEQNYTLDQTAPSQAVTLSSIKLSTDTGSSNTDFITNTAEQTISAELNAILGTGDVLYASVDSGSTWQQVDSSNISGTSISWPATLLNDTNTIQFQVADSADNNGSLTEQSYTLDQTAPSQAVTLSSIKLSTDTGSSNTDFITNTAEQTISAELNASLGSGDVLYASVDSGSTWQQVDSSNISGTSISWPATLPTEGNSSIQFQVADSADNNGSLTEQNYTLDQTAPSQAVTLSSIKLSTDTGSSNTDFITNTAEQTISAELNAILGTGNVLYASADGGTTWQQVDSANISGTSISWTTTLAEGTNTIQFQVADAADNRGDITQQSYTLDTTAPTQSVSSIAFSVDSGTAGDLVTNTDNQTITATLSAALGTDEILFGAVSLDEYGNPAWDNITDNVSGQAISWDATLSAGENDIQFIVEDAAGNSGEPVKQSYFFDNEAPQTNTAGTTASAAEASVATLDAANSTDNYGIASYEWTQVQSDGSALSADDIKLSIANANDATTTVITPGITDDDINSLSFYFSLRITDVAGNYSGATATLNVSNTYTTPDITASASAPNFDQLSLSWPTTTGLTYDLHRSSASGCDLSATENCANYQLYAALDLSGGAQVDSGLELFTPYYYWLEAELNGEVVSLSSTPLEANTTGPALNDTGITAGGDYPSGFDTNNGSNADCEGGYLDSDNNDAFVAFAAEDCELGRDADASLNDPNDGNAGFSFTRLNSDGSEYSGSGDYGTDPWACVLDNVTGLIWEVKTTDDTLRDKDTPFTWYDSDLAFGENGFNGTESEQDTEDLIAYVNGDSNINDGNGLCGLTNWRLPTVQEIQGLADYDVVNIDPNNSSFLSSPALDTDYFPNARILAYRSYWTANLNVNPSANANQPANGGDKTEYFAWVLNTIGTIESATGTTIGSTDNSISVYTRLVSSSATVGSWFSDYTDSRYQDHGDGTISDAKTGLMWMKCTYGQSYDSVANSCSETGALAGDWQAAFANAAESNSANNGNGTFAFTDWRLPNLKELGSIVDFGSYSPAINSSVFPATMSGAYWTGTPFRANDSQAFVIGFSAGDYYARDKDATTATYLRLVRDDVKTPRILTVNINGDNIINAGDSSNLDAIQVSGSTADVEAGQILSLAINTNAYSTSAEIKEDGSFTATIDLTGIADGTYPVTADVSDINAKAANQFTGSLLVDTAAPTISSSVSAAAGTYGIGASVPLTITAIDGETGLTLTSNSFNGRSLGEVTDNQDGTYTTSYTVVENDTDIADGDNVEVNLAFTDPAGNTGTATTSVTLSGASTDAHRPTIASVSVEAGTHGIGASVAITITAGASETGLDLTSATFNGATLGEVTDNDGTYSTTYVVEEGNPHVADGGAVSVNLAFTDPADNVGIAFNTVTLATGTSIDTTPPTQTISDINISDDSGVSDTDFLTNNPNQNISATLSGPLESGDTLHGSVDSGVTWNEITASVSGTAITWNGVTLSSGAIQFKVVDAAGNDGDVSEQAYILDTTVPTIDTTGTDSTVDEGSSANLNASGSDSNGIASYAWQQVASDGSAFSGTVLSIDDSTAASTAVSTPGIADDSGANLSLYFAVTITDNAGNIATSSPLTLTVSNTYTTPDITASIGTAPNFDQLSLSWPTANGLTYDLYRSSAADCDLSATGNCADYELYAAVDLSGGAQIDSGLELFTPYYYWLEAELNGEVVSLSSTPLEANTTDPALNDTGVIQGGDYPSGFDTLGGGVCNGGYLVDDNGDVIADPDNHSGNSTFIAFDNEDCELGRDADATLNDDGDGNAGFSLTRLNSDGSEYSGSGDYGTDPWSCVLDNVTGLIWEVKTNDNTLRDRDEGFTWYNSSTADGTPSDQDTGDFVDYVNGNAEVNSGNGLCGQTNWRLPTVQELVGISDFSTYEPVVDTSYFPNSRTGAYEWSWTADLNSDTENLSNFAWLYNYYIGSIRSGGNSLGATSNSFYVRLVSSSEAVKSYFNDYSSDGGRYTDHEDGTVSDNRTGLMWMKCIYGQAHNLSDNSCGGTGAGAGGTWQEAFAKAAAINEGVGTFGYTDWRLPNMKELLSLVDLSSFQPPINQAIFPNTDGQSQWTSTLSAQDGGDAALAVGLGADPEFGLLGKTTTTTRVRLVRDDVNTPRILTLEINGDNVINSEDDLANIPISGSTSDVEDGQQITLVIDTTTFYVAVSSDTVNDTIDLSTISDGTALAVTADVSDQAGKEANQFTSTLLKDTEPPSITLVVVATDNIINSTEASAATITGTTEGVEDGQILSLAISDGTATVEQTVTVTGNAFSTSANLSSLADGDNLNLTADVADDVGNSAETFTKSITKDTAAPTITIDSVATDGIINASEQSSVVINGTTSGAADDQTVSLALSDGTNTLEATTTVSNNSYSATVDLSSFAESTSISLGVAVSDAAGNEGSASKTDIVKDTLKPSIVSISVTDDNVVNSSEKSNSVAVSGSTDGVEDNQVITLTINGSNITANVSSNSFSTSADLSSLNDGTYNLSANVSDAAGNPADEATGSFEVDTTAPEQAVDPDSIQLSTDSGSSASDFITNQATQTIDATLDAALSTGNVLYASADGGANWLQIYTDENLSSTSISWSTTLLEGTSSIRFQVADSADNRGSTTQQSYTLDTAASTQTISDIDISDDNGTLNDDFLTNIADQTITATLSAALESGGRLFGAVSLDENSDPAWANITSKVSGQAISWDTTLSAGTNDVQFLVEDAAGNSGSITTKAYTLDQTVPTIDTSGTDSAVDEASSANLNASGSDSSGIASYAWAQVESDGSTLTGTALTIDDATAASTSVSTPGIADDGIADQSLYFAVTVTDAAGNPATSSPLTIVVDNSYTTPTISASAVGAPDFNQISLSWDANSSLTYSLYRSTDSNCDLTNYTTCTNPALYTDSTGITSNDTSASVTDTDSSDSFQLFNSYYYWLGGQIDSEVVFLNSTPTIQATNSGPVLNDTGITGGGDYPSGFDNHNGLADGVEGAVCNGGYFTDQGAVVSDLSSYSDTSALTFNPFTDEDCELGRDANATLNDDSDGNAAFVFTKLDISGNVLEASATDWTCVLDHTTGLIWEVKTTDGTWRDRNKAFTWYNPNHGQDYDKDGNTITFDGTESSQDTQDFIAYVNSDPSVNSGSGLCGRSNWRLPTVHEIEGLADYDAVVAVVADDGSTSYSTPTIDTDYFPYALASQYQWYWTSHLNVDPDVNTAGGSSTSNYFAWTYGSAESRTRSGTGSTVGTTDRYNFVRLVSSSAAVASHFSDYSNDRYTDNGDGTISDHQTGLMWSKCSYGQTYDANDANSDGIICEGSPAFGTWQQAFAWAADSTDHGHSDWRLPNIKELGSIVDFGSAKPAINQSIFPNTVSGPYWSSTPSRANVHQTIFIGFQAGDYGPSDRISNLYLRLVRDPN